MANVLYISHTGMTEALGESQVIQYVIRLAEKNNMSILSFEKPAPQEKYDEIKKRLHALNIDWKYYTYSNRFGLLSTAKQMIQAFFYFLKKIKKDHIEIIHARSLIPAVMGVVAKKLCKTKLLFDIRGFAIDEKIESGRLRSDGLLTHFLRKIEAAAYRSADHVVTLTHASKPIIEKKFHAKSNNITVIPTCVNENFFSSVSAETKKKLKTALGFNVDDFVILRSGSVNASYDFVAELTLLNKLVVLDKNIQCLFLNKEQHHLIVQNLAQYPILRERAKILSVAFHDLPCYINACDMCVFFVKPSFAKLASAPTKFAELVACHIYSVTNAQYGDSEYYLTQYRVGTLVDLQDVKSFPEKIAMEALQWIRGDRQNGSIMQKNDFDRLLHEHFSVELAVKKYQKIYDSISVADGTQ